ncbi:MAG: hypothetical protein Q4G26_02885 [Paracoccus sp. (in: a-proteobacteria)]|nr:hypothetical protein [Paracoccus sp. (in: a-proteobacteria)]
MCETREAAPDDAADPASQIDAARFWARKAHQGQIDKLGGDYMAHVKAVIVALLHDVIKDCPNPMLADIARITQQSGPTVGAAVEAMPKHRDKDYSGDLARLGANSTARAVKTADMAHNISRIPLLPDNTDRMRLLRKYATALKITAAEMERPRGSYKPAT